MQHYLWNEKDDLEYPMDYETMYVECVSIHGVKRGRLVDDDCTSLSDGNYK